MKLTVRKSGELIAYALVAGVVSAAVFGVLASVLWYVW